MNGRHGLFRQRASFILMGLLVFLAGCRDPLPKPPCDNEYGNYLTVAPSRSLAASYCKNGKHGILLRTQEGEEWLEPTAAIYTTPAFSPDGTILLITQIDFRAKTSALLAYELTTKVTRTLFRSNEAISFSAITQDKKTVYFWAGTFRASGMTGAADFHLHRLSLEDGKDTILDGPYFVAYSVSTDERGGVHYAYDGDDASGRLVARARKIALDQIKPVDLEFSDLGGAIIYSSRGHYWKARGREPHSPNYKYCVVGTGLAEGVCYAKGFSISFDGKVIAYFDAKSQVHVDAIP